MSNLYIVGFMGVGKTTFSKKIASYYQADWIDLDQYIESYINTSITRYVQKNGMSAFREIESKLFNKVIQKEGYIISTGGGIIENEAHRRWLSENACLFLDYPFSQLYPRLIQEKQTRPLVQQLNQQELYQLYLKRYPIYQEVATKKLLLTGDITIDEYHFIDLVNHWRKE